MNRTHLDAGQLGASSVAKMVGIRAALSNSNMDICGGSALQGKNNNLTIQVNDPGQQDVVSQPSGTVIVNCYKDTIQNAGSNISGGGGYRDESESSSVCIKVQGSGVGVELEDEAASVDFDVKEGKRCNINCNVVNSAKKSRSTQCEDHLDDRLFDEISVAPKVNDQPRSGGVQTNAVCDESAIKSSDHNSSCSGNSSSSSSPSPNNNNHQIETDIHKDNNINSSRPHQEQRPKSFKSTEAQTDTHFLQPNQTTTADASSSASVAAMPGPPPSAAAASLAVAMQINPTMAGQSREERRRERRERRQNRAQNQTGRHCHPNVAVRVSGGGGGSAAAVPPYEILPDIGHNLHSHHLLPPPYSTLPLGATMSGHPPPIVPRLPVGHHHSHHHHHHMAIQRLRSTSPPPVPTSLLMQAPPPVPILQPVPVASIANVVGEDPRFLFQLPVIRR